PSPDGQQKMRIQKLAPARKSYQPEIYKNGCLLPNFAEAMRVLYVNAKPLDDLFYVTIGGNDLQRSRRFEAQLVFTGYSPADQKVIESLSYEERKRELAESSMTTSQVFDRQRRNLDRVLRLLNSDVFRKIDSDLNSLHLLVDFCKFNFVTVLQIFDPQYISADLQYEPSYQPASIEKFSEILEDLYFQVAGLTLTNSTVSMVSALAQLRKSGQVNQAELELFAANIKKIAYVLKHIVSPEKIRTLICYSKADSNYQPKASSYKDSACRNFEMIMQTKFKADEQRIKTEAKNENIRSKLSELFGDAPLQTMQGYNAEMSEKLVAGSQAAFLWVLPMEILKTFCHIYLPDSIKALFNNIVIEGFFNNPTYKTEFSADVYAALDVEKNVQQFEDSFSTGSKYAVSLLEGYLKDSHKDQDFFKKLEQLVSGINAEAIKLISSETNALNRLYKHVVDLVQDSKKPTSEIISNLKVLMISSRNRDSSDLLEQQYQKWEIFFEIMKNYAIITN
ncbi:MAG: DUF5312 domain-containing protein, partial [Treponemataceae bacterium]|nr:DUF5312 domain-containing protein [Treponemataceae bacterium]